MKEKANLEQIAFSIDKRKSYFYYKELINAYYTLDSKSKYHWINSIKDNFDELEFFIQRLNPHAKLLHSILKNTYKA